MSGKPLSCPRDAAPLVAVQAGGVALDRCPKCRGTWCDRGELERLKILGRADLERELAAQMAECGKWAAQPAERMRCPRCGGRLLEQSYSFAQPVRVDRCRSCFGFWLDAGELDRLAGGEPLDEASYRRRLAQGLGGEGPRLAETLDRLFRDLRERPRPAARA